MRRPSPEDLAEVAQIRAGILAEAAAEPKVEVASARDVDADGVPCRVFEPGRPVGTILYLHGGGFVFGTRETHDPIARRLAVTTGHVVVLVDYRLAPEASYPAAVDDSETALAWVLDQDLPAPLVVAGDSAGANLALGLALAHPDAFAAQVLVYPFLDPPGDSYDPSLASPGLDLEACARYWRLYLPAGAGSEVRADPLRASSYVGLPRTLVQLAELDVLTPTGRLLVDRLRADGVPTQAQTLAGVPHGFWRRPEYPQSQAALDAAAAFLREATSAS